MTITAGHSTAMMSLSHLPSVIATLAWVPEHESGDEQLAEMGGGKRLVHNHI